jgi:hypothetical protein
MADSGQSSDYDSILEQVEKLHLMLVEYIPEKERIPHLEAENKFLRSFMDSHYSSIVYNLRIKSKQGQPVWIDVQKASLRDLRELDEDEEIQALIEGYQNLRYRDRDY